MDDASFYFSLKITIFAPINFNMADLLKEIKKRKTFGIIAHPDAGKTTLTEKLLLFGGAIQEAGAVKSNKVKKGATSDFMEIERQRGISVATSVLAFEYKGHKIKVEIALVKGKKTRDKRESIKKRETDIEIRREFKR